MKIYLISNSVGKIIQAQYAENMAGKAVNNATKSKIHKFKDLG
jgi:hypothetical protein